MLTKHLKGVIKTLIVKDKIKNKWFGFVRANDGKEYYFDRREWVGDSQPAIDMEVEFLPSSSPKGYAAMDVIPIAEAEERRRRFAEQAAAEAAQAEAEKAAFRKRRAEEISKHRNRLLQCLEEGGEVYLKAFMDRVFEMYPVSGLEPTHTTGFVKIGSLYINLYGGDRKYAISEEKNNGDQVPDVYADLYASALEEQRRFAEQAEAEAERRRQLEKEADARRHLARRMRTLFNDIYRWGREGKDFAAAIRHAYKVDGEILWWVYKKPFWTLTDDGFREPVYGVRSKQGNFVIVDGKPIDYNNDFVENEVFFSREVYITQDDESFYVPSITIQYWDVIQKDQFPLETITEPETD